MQAKTNNTLIGLFVVILGLVLIAAILWLGTGRTGTPMTRYYVDLEESVAGLSNDSPVKYRGVTIGRVSDFQIDPNHADIVRLELEVDSSIPIREDNVAFLEWQGVTGVAFLNLKGGNPGSPLLRAESGNEYPVIPSGPSLFVRFDEGVSGLIVSLTKTSENLAKMTDEQNREAVASILTDLATVAEVLDLRIENLDSMVRNSALFFERSATAAAEIPAAIEEMETVLRSLDGTLGVVDQTSEELRSVAIAGRTDLSATTAELRATIRRLDRLLGQLEADPTSLVYGRQVPDPGPGESR